MGSEKARTNTLKHDVAFDLAATVFRDSLALTVFDEKHSESEERWATLGRAENGTLLVVTHTCEEMNPESATVRVISARRATRKETRDYEQTPR